MNDHTPPRTNPAYVGDFNRVMKGMSSRISLCGGEPGAAEISNQVAIRTVILNISSARREVTAMRTVCRAFVDEGVWPEGIIETSPLKRLTRDQVNQILDFVTLPVSQLIKIGQELIEKASDALIRTGYPGSEEDIAQALSGVFPNRARAASPNRSTHVPISEGDLSRIDFQMMDQPHEDGVRTLSGPRTNVIALTRTFLRVIWLTGMRPVEMFSCRLMCGDPGRDYTHAQIGLIRKNPEQAAMTGLLIPQEVLVGAEEIGHTRTLLESVAATRIDPVLMIRNAKTRNGNPNLVRPYRVQVLSGISPDDLHLISLAALLHQTPLAEERRRDLINMITRRVRAIASQEVGDRENPVNLYALRHDFATRARRVMPIHQVAALMGHTARGSTKGYGKSRTRQSRSGSGSVGWVPKCDETLALRLQAAFGPGLDDLGQDQTPDQVAEPS
jgi:integrase